MSDPPAGHGLDHSQGGLVGAGRAEHQWGRRPHTPVRGDLLGWDGLRCRSVGVASLLKERRHPLNRGGIGDLDLHALLGAQSLDPRHHLRIRSANWVSDRTPPIQRPGAKERATGLRYLQSKSQGPRKGERATGLRSCLPTLLALIRA